MAASPFFIYLAGVFFFRISCTGGKLRSNQPLVVLRDLLLLLQFKKNMKNFYGGMFLLVKLQA